MKMSYATLIAPLLISVILPPLMPSPALADPTKRITTKEIRDHHANLERANEIFTDAFIATALAGGVIGTVASKSNKELEVVATGMLGGIAMVAVGGVGALVSADNLADLFISDGDLEPSVVAQFQKIYGELQHIQSLTTAQIALAMQKQKFKAVSQYLQALHFPSGELTPEFVHVFSAWFQATLSEMPIITDEVGSCQAFDRWALQTTDRALANTFSKYLQDDSSQSNQNRIVALLTYTGSILSGLVQFE